MLYCDVILMYRLINRVKMIQDESVFVFFLSVTAGLAFPFIHLFFFFLLHV